MAEYVDEDGDLLPFWGGEFKPKRICEPGCLITTDRTKGGMGSDGHTGPCIKGLPGRAGDQTPITDVELPELDCCNACGAYCQMTGQPRRVCEPTCHYVHAQGMPLHKGPCVTCDDPLSCLANLRGAGPALHDPEARYPLDCPQCAVEALFGAQKRTCCDTEQNQWHAELCPHYSAEQGWPQWSSFAALEPPPTFMNEFRRVATACPDCGCASSVARGCRSEWHQRPGKYTMAAMTARQSGKHAAYLMEQQRLLQYYAPEQVVIYDDATVFNAQPWTADVDRTFENEFTMNSEGPQ